MELSTIYQGQVNKSDFKCEKTKQCLTGYKLFQYGVSTPSPAHTPTDPQQSIAENDRAGTAANTCNNNQNACNTSNMDSVSTTPAKSEISTAITALSSVRTVNHHAGSNSNGGHRSTTPGVNSVTQRFRREPSESTLPEYTAYEGVSTTPQYSSHHV